MGIKSKIVGIAALTALATSVMAGGPEPAPVSVCGPFEGLYLGVDGGWTWMKAHDWASDYFVPTVGATRINYVINPSYTNNEFGIGGVMGYSAVFDNEFYFGLELHATYHDLKGGAIVNGVIPTVGTYTANIRARNRWDWGVDLVPGYLINSNTLAFVKFGYRGGDVKLQSTARIGAANAAFVTAPGNNRYANGANLGIGLKYALYQNLSAWVEYDYTWYSHVRDTVIGADLTALPVRSAQRREVRLDYQQVLVGLSYNFCDLV